MLDDGIIVLSEDETIENSFSTDDKQAKFVDILENNKIRILLNKGQQSEVKIKKELAMKLALIQYELTFGKSSNEYQIRKKIHNIKTALKKKAFGQPTVLLKPWQVKFMTILNEVEEEHTALYGDSSVDTVSWSSFANDISVTDTTLQNSSNDARKLQTTHQNGHTISTAKINIQKSQPQLHNQQPHNPPLHNPQPNNPQLHNSQPHNPQLHYPQRKRQHEDLLRPYVNINDFKKKRLAEMDQSYDYEDDDDDLKNPFELPETENLSLEQLQRLVLVKQLNLINIQTEREKLKLKKIKREKTA